MKNAFIVIRTVLCDKGKQMSRCDITTTLLINKNYLEEV